MMTDTKTDIKSEEKKSKYWKFTAVSEELTDNYNKLLGEKGRGFLGKLIDNQVTPEYKDACEKAGRKLNKTKKYLYPAYRYGVIALKEPMTKAEITAYLKVAGAKNPIFINDQTVDDQPMKHIISQLAVGPYFSSLEKKTETFGDWTWDAEARKDEDLVPGEKPELNFYRYYKPRMYSKTEIVNYCYWTNKCLSFLPTNPDDTYSNNTYKFDYPVWSSDTILKTERTFPVVMKCAKRKYDRQHDPEKIKKAKEAKDKRANTRRKKELQRRKNVVLEYSKQLDKMKQKLPADKAELEQICFKMTILNHAAKYLGDYNNTGNSQLDRDVNSIYSMDKIYKLKDKFLDYLYVLNPKELTLSMFDPPQEEFWYDDWGEEHENTRPPHYYACYNFELVFKDGNDYDYHMPYPLAQQKYPGIAILPSIDQIPNGEGPYLFGEEADEDELRYIASMNLLKEIYSWIDKQLDKLGITDLKHAVKLRTNYFDKKEEEMFKRLEKEEREKKIRNKAEKLATQRQYLENNPKLLNDLLNPSVQTIFSKNRCKNRFFTTKTNQKSNAFSHVHLKYQQIKDYAQKNGLSYMRRKEIKAISNVTTWTEYKNMVRRVYLACLPYQSTHGLTVDLPELIASFNFNPEILFNTEAPKKIEADAAALDK